MLGRLLNGSQNKYNFKAVRIHRLIVRNELLKEVGRQMIPIHFDKKCIGIVEETAHSATVGFQDGERVQADFVIGADGLHSRIRPHIAENTEPKFSGLMGVMGTVMGDRLQDIDHNLELPCMLFGQSGSFAIMPASFSGNEVGYFATIESTDRGREGWHALETDKDELDSMLKQRFLAPDSKWPKMVTALCERTPPETLTSWPFFTVPHLDTFSSPAKRVILIGDSAHAIPPTGGQGAAMALEDAETLAYVLSLIYAPDFERSQLSDLLDRWQHHRITRIKKVIDFTDKNGALRKSSPHFYEQAAKEWLIWLAFKWMGDEAGAQWMYQYDAESVLAALADS